MTKLAALLLALTLFTSGLPATPSALAQPTEIDPDLESDHDQWVLDGWEEAAQYGDLCHEQLERTCEMSIISAVPWDLHPTFSGLVTCFYTSERPETTSFAPIESYIISWSVWEETPSGQWEFRWNVPAGTHGVPQEEHWIGGPNLPDLCEQSRDLVFDPSYWDSFQLPPSATGLASLIPPGCTLDPEDQTILASIQAVIDEEVPSPGNSGCPSHDSIVSVGLAMLSNMGNADAAGRQAGSTITYEEDCYSDFQENWRVLTPQATDYTLSTCLLGARLQHSAGPVSIAQELQFAWAPDGACFEVDSNENYSAELTEFCALDIVTAAASWDLAPVERGLAVRSALGSNLPATFPTISKFAGGVATSIWSVDPTLPPYENTDDLRSALLDHVQRTSEFTGADWGGVEITEDMITARELVVGIPPAISTPAQLDVFAEVIERGEETGVTVRLVEVQ